MVLSLGRDIELDEAVFELRRDGTPVPLEPQAFDVLLHLIRHHDRVVPKQELMDTVWGGRFVTEAAVTSRIKQVRRALGDDGRSQRLVRTLHGRGYRYVGEVAEGTETIGSSANAAPAAELLVPLPTAGSPPDGRQPVRYTTSDGLHIAYQVSGSGDTDIVLISGFVSHLELDWDDPRHAHFLDRLGSMGRLIRFDKRGTGMSDRPPGVPDLETRMHDVLAVMDAVGSDGAVLCGYSEGGPMAMLMAAMHPERVSALVLYGTYARRIWAEDYPWAQTQDARLRYTEQLVTRWDWEADLRMRCPSGDAAMQQWWARRMRASATPTTVRALMDMNSLVDVRELLPELRVPTLVVHRTGDALFSVGEARYIADRIPSARLQLLEGADHLVSGDPDQILDAIEPFVAALPRPVHRLGLAAVAAMGGPAATDLTSALVAAGGRLRHAASGDVVVLFDGPATAVRAALPLLEGARSAVCVAIGEVALDGGPVEGVGVDLALALAAGAPAGQLLLSEMAATLAAGSGLRLEVHQVDDNVPDAGDPVFRAVP